MRSTWRDVFRTIKDFFVKYMHMIISMILVTVITFLQFQASASSIILIDRSMSISILVWNLLVIFLAIMLLVVLFKRAHIALLVWSVLSFGFSIANYYIMMFHGAPLSIHLLKNVGTAMDVIANYRITIDKYSGCIFLGFAVCIVIIVRLWKTQKGVLNVPFVWKRLSIIGVVMILLFGVIYTGVFSKYAFKPKSSITWSWNSAARQYGFIPVQLETHFQKIDYLTGYTHYSEESVISLYESISSHGTTMNGSELPDIVLVLNESFYDLQNIINVKTDISPLSNFYATENAITGYAVVPGDSGGTNRSEYELLTSTSLSLLPNLTPFQAMDVAGQQSVVSFLENVGYKTYGAHCAKGSNYNRLYSYSALGFDNSYFKSDFIGLENDGNRIHTDASVYKNLIKWYEEPSEQPKFMYLLTYQNHGGYNQNPSDMDTVHVESDLGEYTDQANEYLSSLRLSDLAFADLLSYFKTVDRPVIVCMLGDHAPSFAKNIENSPLSEQEYSYQIRSTPLIIWSNYGLESKDLGYISLNYVVPKLMETAKLPLSPFYSYQLKLMKEVPIITAYNTYFDNNMVEAPFGTDSVLSEKVYNYLDMCYNNFLQNRLNGLFEPIE